MPVIHEEYGAADAEPVLFIHGAGVAGWMWKAAVDRLEAYRRIVVDLPDHGAARSTPFRGMEEEADAIADFIATLPGGSVHLVGHSLGARLVLEILARRPDTVRSALVASALVRPSALVSLMDSPALNRAAARMLKNKTLARFQAKSFRFPDSSYEDAFLADAASLEPGNLDRPIAAFAARLAPPPGLGRAAAPTLVVAGSREPGSMLGSLADLAALIPGARTRLVEGARHDYPWTRAEEFGAILETWLAEAGRTSPPPA